MALANILAPLFMKRPNDFPTPDEAVDAPDFSLWRHSRRARGEEKERRVLQGNNSFVYLSHIVTSIRQRTDTWRHRAGVIKRPAGCSAGQRLLLWRAGFFAYKSAGDNTCKK